MLITLCYVLVLLAFSVYSYALIDVNITLFNNNLWTLFRNMMVNLGYYHRDLSGLIYVFFVVVLFGFFYYFVRHSRKISITKIALIIGIILLFSYPFISHDLFNYLFDAKIVTWYHQNPYLMRAQDFPGDPWVRFMHWTHRTYPYGPTFLILSLVPSFLSFGKFVLDFFFFKGMIVALYVFTVWILARYNKKYAAIFAFNPLILIEGLINVHNDMIGVCLALIGLTYVLENRRAVMSRLLLLVSGGIKYITFPALFLGRKSGLRNIIIFAAFACGMVYLSLTREVQPWYFLNFFIFLPFFASAIMKFQIFSFGLLLSNYFYLRYGDLSETWQYHHKNILLFIFFAINIFVISVEYIIRKKPTILIKRTILALLFVAAVISRFFIIEKTAIFGPVQGHIMMTLLAVRDHISSLPLISLRSPGNSAYYILYAFFRVSNSIDWMTYAVPLLFMAFICLLLITKKLGFWEKTTLAILLISIPSILFFTRFLNTVSINLLIVGILLEAVFFCVYKGKINLMSRWYEGSSMFRYMLVIFLFVTGVSGLIFYFSNDKSVYALYAQKNIAGWISYYRNKWYSDEKLKGHTYISDPRVQVFVYPRQKDVGGIGYLLKTQYGLSLTDNRHATIRRFFICYGNACRKTQKKVGSEIHSFLRLPDGKLVDERDFFSIYDEVENIRVFAYR